MKEENKIEEKTVKKVSDGGEKEKVKKEPEEEIEEIPEELHEVLESVPPKQRKVIERSLMTIQMAGNIASPESAVMKKITEEHITEYLEGAREEMRNSYEERKSNRWFLLAVVIASMIFFVVIILILKDNPNIMEKVIYTLGGVIAGAFGGYGIGKNKREE